MAPDRVARPRRSRGRPPASTEGADSRTRLLDAAASVFAAKGYRAATVDEVAAAAGLSKGTFYWNFKSKEDLFQTLLEERIDRPARALMEITRTAPANRATASDVSAGLARLLTGERETLMLLQEYWAARDPRPAPRPPLPAPTGGAARGPGGDAAGASRDDRRPARIPCPRPRDRPSSRSPRGSASRPSSIPTRSVQASSARSSPSSTTASRRGPSNDGAYDCPVFDELTFDERGLVPCVAQDFASGEVLTLAYANEESLRLTLETGELHFYSRSREEIWRKGETSGNVLRLRQLRYDCDGDAIVALVEPTGPACHTGERSCFFRALEGEPEPVAHEALATLERTLRSRAAERPEGSYTVELLDDPKLIGEKVEEEAEEVVRAGREESDERVAEEAADLLYHLSVLLASRGVPQSAVMEVLNGRRR